MPVSFKVMLEHVTVFTSVIPCTYCVILFLGVDPRIASFEKINVRGSGNAAVVDYKWIKSIQRVIHDHDVKALTMCDEKLFSGGMFATISPNQALSMYRIVDILFIVLGRDGYLALSAYPPKVLIKYSPLLQVRIDNIRY